MVFLKNVFISTSRGVDVIPVLHDIRFAIRDSTFVRGLVTVTLPSSGAGFVIAPEAEREKTKETTAPLLPSLSIPFQNGELVLAPRQTVFLIDKSSEGKRREFYVQVLGEPAQQPAAAKGPAQRRPRR